MSLCKQNKLKEHNEFFLWNKKVLTRKEKDYNVIYNKSIYNMFTSFHKISSFINLVELLTVCDKELSLVCIKQCLY